MRFSHLFHALVITSCAAHGLAQEGVRVRVGPDIDVDTRGDGVRIQVGPLRIRVGGDSDRRFSRRSQPAVGRYLSDRTLTEAPVLSEQIRTLGQVQDLVFDSQTGRLRFAAISYPGIDAGRRLFAVPLRVLELDLQPQGLMWRTSFEGRNPAEVPQFTVDQWPASIDAAWADGVDSYYGVDAVNGEAGGLVEDEGEPVQDFESAAPPPPQQQPDLPQLERISRLIGQPLLDTSSSSLGTVHRLILDRETGTFSYVAIQDHSADTDPAKLTVIPVPLAVLTCTSVEETVQLSTQLSAEQILNAPRIELERALRPGREDWTADVDAWFRLSAEEPAVRSVPE